MFLCIEVDVSVLSRMLLILCVLAAPGLWIVYGVLSTIVKVRYALVEFKRRSDGLPILPGANVFKANHGVEFHLGRNAPNKFQMSHQKYGKTFGFLYGDKPCASTIDLDLIRLINVSESTKHINRMPFHSVAPEFENNNILLTENDQWRRLRRAFGPALR